MSFPFDLFWQALEGNWVAWFGIGMTVFTFALFVFVIILWWKMPGYGKAGFINNIRGGNPTMIECYENKKLRFRLPQMFRNGLAYDKGGWYIPPKLWATSQQDLKAGERDLLNAVYSVEGSASAVFLNYSVQAQISNPELVIVLQHETELQKLEKGQGVRVKKTVFQAALEHVKDDYVVLSPMNLNFPLDIRGLKTMLPRSLSKSELAEQENRIREDVRRTMGGMGSQVIVVILVGISIALGVASLLKQFGVF